MIIIVFHLPPRASIVEPDFFAFTDVSFSEESNVRKPFVSVSAVNSECEYVWIAQMVEKSREVSNVVSVVDGSLN